MDILATIILILLDLDLDLDPDLDTDTDTLDDIEALFAAYLADADDDALAP